MCISIYIYTYEYNIFMYIYIHILLFFHSQYFAKEKLQTLEFHFFPLKCVCGEARLASELELGGFVGSVGFVPTDSKGLCSVGRAGVMYFICLVISCYCYVM